LTYNPSLSREAHVRTGLCGLVMTSALISGGKIHEIEAMGFTLPLYSKNGWSPFVR
jgi:hypothetical protein